jgi:hypothetical protein
LVINQRSVVTRDLESLGNQVRNVFCQQAYRDSGVWQ